MGPGRVGRLPDRSGVLALRPVLTRRAGLRIGVDATCWQNGRGYGRHARALLGALVRLAPEHRYTFFLDAPEACQTLPPEVEARLVRAEAPTVIAASAAGQRSPADLWRMSRALSAARVDLLLFPTVYSYVPVLSRAKKVVFIHDVIAESFPRLTLPRRTARLLWRAKVALARRQADAIVTVSEYSRSALLRRFRLDPRRLFVVGEASDPAFRVLGDPRPTPRLAGLGLGGRGRSIVYVGGFGPHKNLARLVEVFAELAGQADYADLCLVMVGEHQQEVFHTAFGRLRRQIETLGIAERVVFTGYLPDDELVVLLNLATVLALPSLMEGFGLPAVEAAASGCPVVATTASPLPSLLGEGGLYVDPGRSDLLKRALTWVLSSEEQRRRMRRAGLAAAGRLTWDAAGRQLQDVLRQVVA